MSGGFRGRVWLSMLPEASKELVQKMMLRQKGTDKLEFLCRIGVSRVLVRMLDLCKALVI